MLFENQVRLVCTRSRVLVLAGVLLALVVPSLLCASAARAAHDQIAMFEDDPVIHSNPDAALFSLRSLGVQMVRLPVPWENVAPNPNSRRRPSHFNGADPAAYPARHWRIWDQIVRAAQRNGIQLDMNPLGGAPLWATGRGAPRSGPHHNWMPSPSLYAQFVRALGTRYSGHYKPPHASSPLPRVSFWGIWNEPDYGPSLAPQGVYPHHLTVENSPRMYRNLVDAAWSALHRTGHGEDTILFGELAPRGAPTWGIFSGMKPVIFLRAMYCVDSHYRPLRGSAAAIRGCPTTAGGSRAFRARNPALFSAAGFSDHPYMRWYHPDHERHYDPNYTTLGEIGVLKRTLDRLQRVYGSGTRFAIWDTEFGYITSPPKHDNKYPYVSPTTAAYYLNWAEYVHWRDPRLRSYNQYLLRDPLPALPSNDWGGYASGLLTYQGKPKPGYDAYRLPLYMPSTKAKSGQSLEVWGCARAAYFASKDAPDQPAQVEIQFAPSGSSSWRTVSTVKISDPRGYFDQHVVFRGSGTVRLRYTYPTGDSMLPDGTTITSRSQRLTVG
jgi:hypothetical protein